MKLIQHRFGLRKYLPYQCIKEIMPVLRSCWHLTCQKNLWFILLLETLLTPYRRNKADHFPWSSNNRLPLQSLQTIQVIMFWPMMLVCETLLKMLEGCKHGRKVHEIRIPVLNAHSALTSIRQLIVMHAIRQPTRSLIAFLTHGQVHINWTSIRFQGMNPS